VSDSPSPVYFIGADPDMHTTALAVVDAAGSVLAVFVIKSPDQTDRAACMAMVSEIRDFFVSDQLPRGCFAFAVESQEIAYTAKGGKNPRSLLLLANISGALLASAHFLWGSNDGSTGDKTGDGTLLMLPAPQAWKGSIPKQAHQLHVLRELGWEPEKVGPLKTGYCRPKVIPATVLNADVINPSDWKHVIDAIGLARWAWASHNKQTAISAAVASAGGTIPDPAAKVKKRVKPRVNKQEGTPPARKRKNATKRGAGQPSSGDPGGRDLTGPQSQQAGQHQVPGSLGQQDAQGPDGNQPVHQGNNAGAGTQEGTPPAIQGVPAGSVSQGAGSLPGQAPVVTGLVPLPSP